MANLVQMKYRVCMARSPRGEGTLRRPVVVGRHTMGTKQLIAYAKTAGFVRGQQKDLEGLLGGFIEAMQDRAKAGYSINVNDWFIISGRLRGTVGEDRRLTDANDYHVTITASKDLKVGINSFAWSCVDDTRLAIRVDNLSSPDGVKNEVVKTKTIVVNGNNLAFNAAWGDSVVVSWLKDDQAESVEIVPNEQSATYLRFNWPSQLAEAPDGAMLTFTFNLHGSQDGAEQKLVKTAKLVAAA